MTYLQKIGEKFFMMLQEYEWTPILYSSMQFTLDLLSYILLIVVLSCPFGAHTKESPNFLELSFVKVAAVRYCSTACDAEARALVATTGALAPQRSVHCTKL